jgi:hypothetical protein
MELWPAESGEPPPVPKKSNSMRAFRSYFPEGKAPFTPSRLWRALRIASPSSPNWPSTVGIFEARSMAFQSGFTRLKSWM